VEIKVGCCGYPVSRGKYYQNFDCVEINVTFYQLPEIKTAFKWRKEAPENFEFILKAWQLITHPASSFTYRRLKEKIPENKKKNYGFFQPTNEVFTAWERTKEFAENLGCKKILFQSPGSFKPTPENKKNLKNFFYSVTPAFAKSPTLQSFGDGVASAGRQSPSHPITFLWEPRGEWEAEEIKEICKELNLIHCVDPVKIFIYGVDPALSQGLFRKGGVDPTINIPLYGQFNYFRLHGSYLSGRIDYNYQFSDKELNKVFKMCTKPLNYVMFNNSTMFADALRFKKLVPLP